MSRSRPQKRTRETHGAQVSVSATETAGARSVMQLRADVRDPFPRSAGDAFPFNALVPLFIAAQRQGRQEGSNGPAVNALLEGVRAAALRRLRAEVPLSRAEDLAQELLIRVEACYQRVIPATACGQFLATAINRLIGKERRGRPLRSVPLTVLADALDDHPEIAVSDDLATELEDKELYRQVLRAIRRLSPYDVRVVGFLACVMAWSQPQIARYLKVKPRTVRRRVAEARSQLRADPDVLRALKRARGAV